MPKDNIQRAIKKATDKDTSDYKEVTFGCGPHGIAVYVETTTDNNNRTVTSIRSDFAHNGGNLGTTGNVEFYSIGFAFNIKGGESEELELELIDFGAEEIEVDEDQIIIRLLLNVWSLQKQLNQWVMKFWNLDLIEFLQQLLS